MCDSRAVLVDARDFMWERHPAAIFVPITCSFRFEGSWLRGARPQEKKPEGTGRNERQGEIRLSVAVFSGRPGTFQAVSPVGKPVGQFAQKRFSPVFRVCYNFIVFRFLQNFFHGTSIKSHIFTLLGEANSKHLSGIGSVQTDISFPPAAVVFYGVAARALLPPSGWCFESL